MLVCQFNCLKADTLGKSGVQGQNPLQVQDPVWTVALSPVPAVA